MTIVPLQSYRRNNILSPLEKINNPDIIRVIDLIRFSEMDPLGNKGYIQKVLSLYGEWEKLTKNPYQPTQDIEILLMQIKLENISLSCSEGMKEDYLVIATWINDVTKFIQNDTGMQELILTDINALLGSLRNPATAKISLYGIPETIVARISQAQIIFPDDRLFHHKLSLINEKISHVAIKSGNIAQKVAVQLDRRLK